MLSVFCQLRHMPQLHSSVFISFSTDRLQVSLGLPLFLLPAGVHSKATLGIAVSSILLTYAIQHHLLRLISVDSGVDPVIRWSSVLEMMFVQKILRIRRRHLHWKTSNLLLMGCVTYQDSEPYRRTVNTLLLKVLSFVGRLMCVDLKTLCRVANAPPVFDILLSTSLSEFPSLVILLPRYTNSSTSSKAVLLTGSSFFALIFMSFVFVMLMLRPICFPSEPCCQFCLECLGCVEKIELCHRRI